VRFFYKFFKRTASVNSVAKNDATFLEVFEKEGEDTNFIFIWFNIHEKLFDALDQKFFYRNLHSFNLSKNRSHISINQLLVESC